MNPLVLIVDDEPDAVELLEVNLQRAGFNVASAPDGNVALEKAQSLLPDVILLDVMLPRLDGLQVCKLLRRNPGTATIPVVMLTARTSELDRVLGLELGADDYITKPYSQRELILRIRNVLRRCEADPDRNDQVAIGPVKLDVPRHQVTVNNRTLKLTATEFKLLSVLMERRGRVQSREQLLQEVWNYSPGVDTRTVDTHVRRLREKLGPAARLLDTVRGVGYRFAEV